MKALHISLAGLALLLFSSCSQDVLTLQKESSKSFVVFDVSYQSSPSSRTQLDSDKTTVLWSPGDRINLFNGYLDRACFTNTAQVPCSQTGFEGYLKVINVGMETSAASNDFWAIYPYDEDNTCDGTCVTMTLPDVQEGCEGTFAQGLFPSIAHSNSFSLCFYNICGGLCFTVYNEGIKTIRFRSNGGQPLAGQARVKCDLTPEVSLVDSVSAPSSIALNAPDGGTFTPGVSYYLAAFPSTLAEGYTVTFIKDGEAAEFASSSEVSIKRSIFAKLEEKDKDLVFKPLKDLSSDGTANTYIISTIGNYTFDCSVKGSGSEPLDAAPVSVSLLYSSSEGLVNGLRIENGYVSFSTPDELVDGNVVVGVKDAGGNLLWAWTLWISEDFDPAATATDYANGAGKMMDRNIGALSASSTSADSRGFLYAWGSAFPSVEGLSLSAGEWDGSRSDYDPCPKGWRVPDGGNAGVWVTADFTSAEYDAVNFGVTFPSECCGAASWFPAPSLTVNGLYWSCTAVGEGYSALEFASDGSISPRSVCAQSRLGYIRCASVDNEPIVGVDSVKLNPSRLSLFPQDAEDLICTIYPSEVNLPGVVWSSSDTTVVTVSQSGHVVAVKPGKASVRATSYSNPDAFAECSVSVEESLDLSAAGTANCYIIPAKGRYKFRVDVKGSSNETVGPVSSVSVLWESRGDFDDITPGTLLNDVVLDGNYVIFSVPSAFVNGNAVIAANNADGDILWSWHLWFAEGFDPDATAQVYANNAGTLMDRNLGSILYDGRGTVGQGGLLYQWGRKDPFLNSGSLLFTSEATSTVEWPEPVKTDDVDGNIAYSVMHPMVFLTEGQYSADWIADTSTEDYSDRWTGRRTLYDPCPHGWRVADGGPNGVWCRAASSGFVDKYDGTYKGYNFQVSFGTDRMCWYPSTGYRDSEFGSLKLASSLGYYWSCTAVSIYAYMLNFDYMGSFFPKLSTIVANAAAVRCQKIEN